MPLLARPSVYQNAKRGKARGGEAVILVETVRMYRDVLKRLEAQHSLAQPASGRYGIIGSFFD
jgi:membrane-bound lytic murein transglycosylase F